MIKEIIVQMLGYMVSMFIAFGIIAWWQRGFFFPFIKTKGSAGKKLLIKILTKTKPIYRVGEIKEGNLYFKNSDKKMIVVNNLPKEAIYRDLGIFFVEYDDETNKVIIYDTKDKIPAVDPEKMNSLYLRALYRPSILDQKTQLLIILSVITLIMIFAIIYLNYSSSKKIQSIATSINAIRSIMLNNGSNIIT